MVSMRRINTSRLETFAKTIGQKVEIEQRNNQYISSLYLGKETYKFGTIAGRGTTPKKAVKSLISLINSDKSLKKFVNKYIPQANILDSIKKLFKKA